MDHHPSRNHHVDNLRGIAISCVLLLHFALAYGVKDSPLGTLLPPWLLKSLVWNGNYGVTMFFVVSGFLITSQSLRRWGSLAAIDIRAFYVFRFARIMPMLLLALAIIVALGCLGLPYFINKDHGQAMPASFFLVAAGSVLTFWHNLLMQQVGYFNYSLNVYWSLSVEEVFYLALPLLCVCLRRVSLLTLCCALLIVVAPIYRGQHADNEIDYLYGYLACFDAIAIGCLAALIARRRPLLGRAARLLRWVGGLLLAFNYLRGFSGHEAFGFTWLALSAALFLLGAAADPTLRGGSERLSRPLRWLGRHSYEIYLFHIIVLALLRNLVPREAVGYWTRLPLFIGFLLLTVLVAGLIGRYLAEPLNRGIRNRYLNRRGPAAAASLPSR
ncbi:acyltransferase [Chromobacterium subtsugae]|uniref:Acyltransferase n=1 Tax=Chromobacterium subtsugae TaxID=251747 RepID=A0ABS7F820_9NEIS|nr:MULTISPECIES: acyltransferase [Chromobacterium]KUM01741.1 O-antigen acetylase [Chromobacterium subtsugae]KZE83294.1 O-antigen acetylase [Chromobacterium sp. F49]MBW7565238.1 acyltransferase [Chromobacterium subtsugae]MBW8286234.1 acyltransferase [Chromobacterium subtsugae]WSE91714.1 acyltransferase [Chromobacterium subtsugae]